MLGWDGIRNGMGWGEWVRERLGWDIGACELIQVVNVDGRQYYTT